MRVNRLLVNLAAKAQRLPLNPWVCNARDTPSKPAEPPAWLDTAATTASA